MSAEIKPRAFIILWLIGGLAVLPLTVVLAMALIPALREAMGIFIDTSAYYFWDDHFYIFVAVFGLTNGFCIGILQQVVVRHCFRVNLRRWWQFSTVGGGLAATISMSANFSFQSSPPDFLTNLIALGILFGLLSSMQALVLRRYARGAWKWVAAHLIALPVVIMLNDSLLYFDFIVFLTFIPLRELLIILPVILSTLLVMRRSLLETRRGDKVKRGAAAG